MNVRREALTQSERDVVYAVRDFERFRSEFIVDVISEYLGVVQQYQNLDNVQANFESVRQSREQIEALFDAGERSIIDVDRARQDELTAENRVVDAQNSLQSRLDSFKLTLGLPTDATIRLDEGALAQIEARGVDEVSIDEHEAIELALDRRYSHRTARDEVEDASRRVVVAENTLQSQLDFAAVIRVPSKPDEPLQFDWSQVQWAAGFDLELALNKLIERNAYRSSLINLNDRMRNRDQSEDSIKFQVRNSLRNILTTIENYKIQSNALTIAEQRVDSTRELYLADEAAALDVLDAQNSLLEAQLRLTTAIVDYSIARLGLLLDLEAVPVEPKGLRLDLALPLPTATAPPD